MTDDCGDHEAPSQAVGAAVFLHATATNKLAVVFLGTMCLGSFTRGSKVRFYWLELTWLEVVARLTSLYRQREKDEIDR